MWVHLIGFSTSLTNKPTELRVEVELLRKAETRNTATKKRAGQKARDLLKLYPEAKAKDLMARLRTQGLWAWDEDFEKDEEDWGENKKTKIYFGWFQNEVHNFFSY